MPLANNWKVTIIRNRESENLWIATAEREGFSFTQNVAGNEGEITEFCKTARVMFKQHTIDKARAAELSEHFDDILEREDQREAAEAAQAKIDAEAKAKADAEAAVKAEADRIAAEQAATVAALPPPPAPEPEPAATEPIQDAPTVEESNEKSS